MKKLRYSIEIVCILMLFIWKLPLLAAENAELPDLDRTGSITINFIDSETGKGFSFGNKVGLFKVAEVTEENGYQYVYDELFESVGEPPATAEEMNSDLAYRLLETAEYKGISLDVPSEELSENGKVTFNNIGAGLYLVSQTHRGTDSARFQIEPFLVTVPVRMTDGSFLYDVEVTYETGTGEAGTAKIALNNGAVMADSSIMPAQEKKSGGNWITVIAVIIVVFAVFEIFFKK